MLNKNSSLPQWLLQLYQAWLWQMIYLSLSTQLVNLLK